MIFDIGYVKAVTKRILTLILSLIGIYLAFKMAVFYMPFLIAFIISTMVEPIIKKLAKNTNFTRKTCAIIVLVLVFAIIVGLLTWGIWILIDEGANVLKMLNEYISKIYEFVLNIIDKFKFEEIKVSDEVTNIIKSSTSNFLNTVSEFISNILNSIITGASSITKIGIYTVITIIATYFISADRIYILDQIEHHVPRDWVKKMTKNINKIIKLLGGYLKAQVILVLINFILVLIRTIRI